jgi:mono/diheme cytochrome c family protein
MQVKVVIGTIAFMLTMMILGFAALREPARLEAFTAAFNGRSIETGARLYDDNCATCHGINGEAAQCFDVAGNETGCQGLPLNSASLLCGDKSQRMIGMGWEGTKRAFVETTVAAGRLGSVMPTWSADFGGPMRADQIQDVSAYVLNWERSELCSEPVVVYDWPESVDDYLEEFPDGDVANGEELFLRSSYICTSCHGNPDGSVAALVGPDLSQIATDGATRVEGYSAAQYVYESILDPMAFTAPDCPNGPCVAGGMPNIFATSMSANPQDMSDILAYLLQER